ncbi:helix-turn-helix domain-containing protein [Sphingobium boeckii]|uniref:Transcriptional regulator with XRE-family HTH domain n=1 Tax=Sphingobium boeckii TaxID=1082345 RepID=A0A7W9ALF4_9SPHN|nr:helix-turn-helix transcriptional regulator [Sphingobium boeckii]MBB5687832.1 transcriptional regulator with XRE-family HTH domain [Sphingobium boeckii]
MTGETDLRALIAQRLREARTLAGLSQGQVAKILNMHRPSISEIEAGNRRVSAEELARFAEIYGVNISYLTGDASDTLSIDDPRLKLAARELQNLPAESLDALLKALAALKHNEDKKG